MNVAFQPLVHVNQQLSRLQVFFQDPPKKGVDEAVLMAQRAGVKAGSSFYVTCNLRSSARSSVAQVVMVTGDHPDTARAIAGASSCHRSACRMMFTLVHPCTLDSSSKFMTRPGKAESTSWALALTRPTRLE